MFEIIEKEGVKFIFSAIKGMGTSAVGVFVNVGARYENNSTKGIAHFLEHIVFKGSKKYSYKKIKEEIEGRGGILNGFTSQEVTGYYSYCLSYNIEKTLDILLDMVLFPLLNKSDIEKERNVILEEIKMHNDLPHARASSLLDSLLWPQHPLGKDVIGDIDTVKNIKRADLYLFKKRFYSPSNIIIVCVSDYNKDKISKLILNKTKGFLRKNPHLYNKCPSSLSKSKILIEKKEIDQCHLCIGFRAPSARSKARFIIELIHIILGANMSSRLFEELREKRGLCYDISTEVKRFKDSGAFSIHVGLDSRNIIIALKRIFRELKLLKEKEVSKKELERAKDYFLGQMFMNIERPQGRMFYLIDSYLTMGRIYSLTDIRKFIHRIDSFSIKEWAKKIFSFGKVCVTCVSPVKNNLRDKIKEVIYN